MFNLKKCLFLMFLVLAITLIKLSNCQASEYENIISSISLNQENKNQNKEKEGKSNQPISPIFFGKWWCDPNFKLNSVRDEVMTNDNFNM